MRIPTKFLLSLRIPTKFLLSPETPTDTHIDRTKPKILFILVLLLMCLKLLMQRCKDTTKM